MKRLLLLLVLLLAMPLAGADGVYTGPPGFVPAIPNQRAVIFYNDGVQTLIVQSTLDAPKGEYAWVVPLPAEPTQYAEGKERLFENWEYSTRPTTLYHVPSWLDMAPVFCGILLFGLVLAPFAKEDERIPLGWIAGFILVALVVSQVKFLRSPTDEAMKSAEATTGGVEVLESREVGSYQVDVVKGRTSAALSEWLTANKTPLPEKAESIVQEYVAKGWVFMAVKMREHAGGLLEPHPLAVEFPSAELVYPMRLTGLSQRTLLLDLYVVADGTVEMEPLKMWYSDRLSALYAVTTPTSSLDWSGFLPFDKGSSAATFSADSVLTRLRGEILPADMDRDYVGNVGAVRPFQLTLYSQEYAGDAAAGWACWIALGFGLLAYFGLFRFVSSPFMLASAVLLLSFTGGAIAWSMVQGSYPVYEEGGIK